MPPGFISRRPPTPPSSPRAPPPRRRLCPPPPPTPAIPPPRRAHQRIRTSLSCVLREYRTQKSCATPTTKIRLTPSVLRYASSPVAVTWSFSKNALYESTVAETLANHHRRAREWKVRVKSGAVGDGRVSRMMGESEGVKLARDERRSTRETEATSKVCRRHLNGVLTVEGEHLGSSAGVAGERGDVRRRVERDANVEGWAEGSRAGCIGAGDALDGVGKPDASDAPARP